jgi:hypothetical protein
MNKKFDFMIILFFFFFVVLGFEPRTYTLSHSTSPFFVKGFFFEIGSRKLFALAGFDLPDLCLLSIYDYRCEPLAIHLSGIS